MHRTLRVIAFRGAYATAATPRSRWTAGRASLALTITTCVLAVSGCASSSSETPWPVEPDFERLRAEAKGHPRMAHAGTEWTPREPEGDESAEPAEEPDPVSTWGSRRKPVPEPLPLKAGTPDLEDPDTDADVDEDDEPAPPKAPPPKPAPPKAAPEPKSPPAGLGDTDDIDDDPFFQDDSED